MILSINASNFNSHNLIINNKTKNNIMNNSDFLRVYYSDQHMSTNGVFVCFSLNNINIEKYFNKIKCIYEKSDKNKETIQEILRIEKKILNKLTNSLNTPVYRIEEQLLNYFIKIFSNDEIKLGYYKKIKFVLKISGIWSTDIHKKYGLTFRFFIINKS